MVFLALVVLTTATVAVLQFESNAPEANIQTGHDALWWSIVTMSTVGYGDFYPTTAGGRLAAVDADDGGHWHLWRAGQFSGPLFLPTPPDDEAPGDRGRIGADPAGSGIRSGQHPGPVRRRERKAGCHPGHARPSSAAASRRSRTRPWPSTWRIAGCVTQPA